MSIPKVAASSATAAGSASGADVRMTRAGAATEASSTNSANAGGDEITSTVAVSDCKVA